MVYFTGDTHFGYENVLGFDDRPFGNVDIMDKILIENWNSRVRDKDDVYILGDFAYRTDKPFSWYLSQLKGRKHLIAGNHDRRLLKDLEAVGYFSFVSHYLELKYDKKRLVLSHYPIAEWNGFFRESWHLYGHIHNNTEGVYQFMKQFDRALNAGCMVNNYMPVTFEELVMNNQLFKEQN